MKRKSLGWTRFLLLASLMVACGANKPTEEPTVTAVVTASGLRVGDTAPDGTLPDNNGDMVLLSDELKDHKMVVLVFYHPDT
jgi:hypothetical protein